MNDLGYQITRTARTGRKRKIRLRWSCTDYTPGHEHNWYWSAWLCGRLTWIKRKLFRRGE